jgi:hypothetical protein
MDSWEEEVEIDEFGESWEEEEDEENVLFSSGDTLTLVVKGRRGFGGGGLGNREEDACFENIFIKTS